MPDALLLMDLQTEILDRFAVPDAFVERAVAVQAEAIRRGDLVVLVHVGFRDGHPEIAGSNLIFGSMPGTGRMLAGSPANQPHPRLLRGAGEVVVTKRRVSAFAGSDLEQVLRARGATRLVLGGVSTSGVVLSTVREAADKDYELTVLADLCADADEEMHRVLLEKIFPRQCRVTTSEEWVASKRG